MFRIGQSSDIHPLAEGRKLILGGVEIEHTKGLLGHSDADALTHAVAESILGALALGFVAYGLSIRFYIYAQRGLGAAKTSAYYALAPFLGAGLSLVLFRQRPQPYFWAALLLMAVGTWLASTDQ